MNCGEFAAKPLRVLVVDDDQQVRKMLRRILERMGQRVTEAQNGKEALAEFERCPVELVITDLFMPEKDGIETIENLRKLSQKVKIIAMSGDTRIAASTYLEMSAKLGANRTLVKPFSIEKLTLSVALCAQESASAALVRQNRFGAKFNLPKDIRK
jgi:CheY-like chemotaxis protein